MDLLAPDVVYLADAGGRVPGTVPRPIYGPDKVARLIIGLFAKGNRMGDMTIRSRSYNGMPSLVVSIDGVVDQVNSIEVTEGMVTAIYCVRNRAKLASVRH
jgi:RNA polymerase sigma-70 factor (ECF subfamily)